jgi:site-specific recombinase XerD
MECLRLRVKDLDFDHRAITVRSGKGGKDRGVLGSDSDFSAARPATP